MVWAVTRQTLGLESNCNPCVNQRPTEAVDQQVKRIMKATTWPERTIITKINTQIWETRQSLPTTNQNVNPPVSQEEAEDR